MPSIFSSSIAVGQPLVNSCGSGRLPLARYYTSSGRGDQSGHGGRVVADLVPLVDRWPEMQTFTAWRDELGWSRPALGSLENGTRVAQAGRPLRGELSRSTTEDRTHAADAWTGSIAQ